MNSSWLKTIGSPLRCGIVIGAICASNLPAFCAASALFCDAVANASCSSLVISNLAAMFSAVIPIWILLYASVSASAIIESTKLALPILKPSRIPATKCGESDIFSCPPAITISASPAKIACAPKCTAFKPEPQT